MANGYGGSLNTSYSSNAKKGDKIKIIRNFILDVSNIKAKGEIRSFTINGTKDSVFSLIILNNHGSYYNFDTEVFSTPLI